MQWFLKHDSAQLNHISEVKLVVAAFILRSLSLHQVLSLRNQLVKELLETRPDTTSDVI
jgi:hypothetical protein